MVREGRIHENQEYEIELPCSPKFVPAWFSLYRSADSTSFEFFKAQRKAEFPYPRDLLNLISAIMKLCWKSSLVMLLREIKSCQVLSMEIGIKLRIILLIYYLLYLCLGRRKALNLRCPELIVPLEQITFQFPDLEVPTFCASLFWNDNQQNSMTFYNYTSWTLVKFSLLFSWPVIRGIIQDNKTGNFFHFHHTWY